MTANSCGDILVVACHRLENRSFYDFNRYFPRWKWNGIWNIMPNNQSNRRRTTHCYTISLNPSITQNKGNIIFPVYKANPFPKDKNIILVVVAYFLYWILSILCMFGIDRERFEVIPTTFEYKLLAFCVVGSTLQLYMLHQFKPQCYNSCYVFICDKN